MKEHRAGAVASLPGEGRALGGKSPLLRQGGVGVVTNKRQLTIYE